MESKTTVQQNELKENIDKPQEIPSSRIPEHNHWMEIRRESLKVCFEGNPRHKHPGIEVLRWVNPECIIMQEICHWTSIWKDTAVSLLCSVKTFLLHHLQVYGSPFYIIYPPSNILEYVIGISLAAYPLCLIFSNVLAIENLKKTQMSWNIVLRFLYKSIAFDYYK